MPLQVVGMLTAALLLFAGAGAQAQGSAQAQSDVQACTNRPTYRREPWVVGAHYCLEDVLIDPSGGVLSYTALATAPDGRLFAARPLAGEVYTFDDGDGDGLPETPRLLLGGLTLPNALVWHADALYIAGGTHLYRWSGDAVSGAGELRPLVDDLPAGAGFWTGGLAVGEDGRLYVGIGAACDACVSADALRGTILSFAPDGADRRVVAAGLRQPAGLAFHAGSLWVVDTARDGALAAFGRDSRLDELNRVPLEPDNAPLDNAPPHFGFPFCIGMDNSPDTGADLNGQQFDCAAALPPALALPTQSTPVALASYSSDTLPRLTNTLLVALYGEYGTPVVQYLAVALVRFDDAGMPADWQLIIPEAADPGFPPITLEALNLQLSGFYPQRPLGLTVSAQGWVYVSVSSGRILALRPNVLE